MGTNRILRYYQKPEGVYHGNVFYQMSGGIGPIALTIDNTVNEHLYIAKYDIIGMK